MSEELKRIAEGPTNQPFFFDDYIINKCHFNTKSLDDKRVNQNSDVIIVASTMQFSNTKDKNFIYRDMIYYGVVKKIWELDYHTFRIPISKYDWVESNYRINVDKLGLLM